MNRLFSRRSFSLFAMTSLSLVIAHCTTYSGIELGEPGPGGGGNDVSGGAAGRGGTGSGGSMTGGAGGAGSTTNGGSGGSAGQGGNGSGAAAGLPDASVTDGSSGSGGSIGSGGAAGSGAAGSGGIAGNVGKGGASGAAGTQGTPGTGGVAGSGGTGGVAGATGSGGASGSGGAAGSGGAGGAAGSGGATGSGGTTGTDGAAGSGGAGGSAGSDGGAGKGGTGGSAGSGGAMDASAPPTCTQYVPDASYPCAMGVPSQCGSNPVNCGSTICPAHSSCGSGNTCPCNTGYLPVACSNGMKCSSSSNPCTGGQWGCLQRPDPGCSGNPSTTAGVCHCSDGKTYTFACGSTTTCEQRCRQGS
jgi:hypothetical protein